MGDLISREALLGEIKDYQMDIVSKATAIKVIRNAPTVEVVPVMYGEWIDTQPEYNSGVRNNAHVCSNCHDYYTTEYDDLYFCPRCGADMRKKV